MKILHTADWHLGGNFHNYERADEHRHFLRWLLHTLQQEKPDTLIVAGDVFDTPNPPASAMRMFYDFLAKASEAVEGLQVVVLAGNHDSGARLEAAAEVFRLHNVYLRGIVRRTDEGEPDYDHFILPLARRGEQEASMVCFALPYLRSSDYKVGLSPAEGLRLYLDSMTKLLKASPFKGLPVVLAAHIYTTGAEISDGEHSERLVVGGQDCIDPRTLGRGFAYVALGHIHKPQAVKGLSACYAGSALPMSFAERAYRHGVQRVELDDEGVAHTDFLPYKPLRGLLTLPANGAATPPEVLAAIEHLPDATEPDDGSWPYAEINVKLQGPEPALVHTIQKALSSKAVRFCRVQQQTAKAAQAQPAPTLADTLAGMAPIDIARKVFKTRYAENMPDALEERFRLAQERAESEE